MTRKMNEMLNLITTRSDGKDVSDKINDMKHAMEELGVIQDELMSLVDEGKGEELEEYTKWYNSYVRKTNLAIKEARDYLSSSEMKIKTDTAIKRGGDDSPTPL